MNESGRTGGRASPTPPAATLSPLVKPLPVGYRNIQPFRKGQGWHSNGQPKRAKPSLLQLRGDDDTRFCSPGHIIFPVIQGHEPRLFVDDRPGPDVSAVDGASESENEARDDHDRGRRQAELKDGHNESAHPSPCSEDPIVSVTFRPLTTQNLRNAAARPPSAPRRPFSVGCDPHGSPSFRTRALANATSGGCTEASNNDASSSRPTSPTVYIVSTSAEPQTKDVAVQSSLGEQPKRTTGARSIAELVASEEGPDPALVQQLWQEFNERAQAQRAIDRDEYHRKMQRKYNERKALREQVARLERALADSRRERDTLLQHLGLESADDSGDVETDTRASPAPSPHRSPNPSPRVSPRATVPPSNALDHRGLSFQLQRALADTKQQLGETEALLTEQQTKMQMDIDGLEARLELEKRTNTALTRQLRETSDGLQLMADELVDTRVQLERVLIGRQIDKEQSQHHIQQLLRQHRRDLVVAEAKQVLRHLGRQALQEKVRAFHSRAIIAEQRMRASQEEAMRLQQEVDSRQRALEQLLSAQALRAGSLQSVPSSVDCLAAVSGENCADGIVLFHGTKSISGRAFLLHIVCDYEVRDSSDNTDVIRVHFVVLDPVSGQHDCLTFRLPDIRRLVVDSHTYTTQNSISWHQQLSDLAALLLPHVHAGYKSGRLVLCELPSMSSDTSSNSVIKATNSPVLREVVAYRGTRAIACYSDGRSLADAVTADLTVNEVFSTQTPQTWWVKIHTVVLDAFLIEGADTWELQEDSILEVDHQQLVALCPEFDGYRPTDRLDKLPPHSYRDLDELMVVHEAMLLPLFAQLRVFISTGTTSSGLALRLDGLPSILPSETAKSIVISAPLSAERLEESPVDEIQARDGAVTTQKAITTHTASQTLDHRCIVNVGGVFYCTRFLELWDDELQLEVTLDDPESAAHVTGVLQERHLAAIATYLHASGAVPEDLASQLELGLPTSLQAPLCKLLTRHLRRSRVDRHAPVAVLFSSLLREIGFASDVIGAGSGSNGHADAPTPGELPGLASKTASEATGKGGIACVSALGCQGVSEEQIHGLLLQIKTPQACRLRQARRGVRLRSESGARELALVQIYDGFTGFGGVAIVSWPLSASGDVSRARVEVLNEPFGPQTLELLGEEHRAE